MGSHHNGLRSTTSRVLAVHLALFALTFLAGALTSHSWSPGAAAALFEPAAVAPGAQPFRVILRTNALVIGQLMAGTVSAGVFSAVLLSMLGFRIGADTMSVWTLWPDGIGWWIAYATFEYAAFVLAATAAGAFGVELVRWLLGGGQPKATPFAVTVGAAFGCLVLGALLETWCIASFGRR